jgi:hypothetical protein
MSARFHTTQLSVLALAGLLLAAPRSAGADETTPATPPAPTDATPAATPPPAPPKPPKPAFHQGVQRLHLHVGWTQGGTARDAGILASPLTGEPGATNYPAKTPLTIRLDGGATFQFGYTYFFDQKWGLDLGISHQATQMNDPKFDLADTTAQVNSVSGLTQSQRDNLLARLVAHAQPHDFGLTYFDFGGTRVFAPASKWPFELGAGMGWAFGSLSSPNFAGRAVYERIVTSRVVSAGDPVLTANEVDPDGVPFVEKGCLADNDPCIEVKETGGLTWNVSATAHRRFSDRVMFDIGARTRYVTHVLDPGDAFSAFEFNAGVSFLFGGR